MFGHFIYSVEDSLDGFDPGWDLLLDPYAFLTWRRVDQTLPVEAGTKVMLYGAAYHELGRQGKLIVVRFDAKRSFRSAEAWIQQSVRRYSAGRLGKYEHSEFYRLLAPIKHSDAYLELRRRIDLIANLSRQRSLPSLHITFPNNFPVTDLGEWQLIREQLIQNLMLADKLGVQAT